MICASPIQNESSAKFAPIMRIPTNGVIMFSTNEDTILEKAPQITTQTARSMTLPFIAKFLNSWRRDMAAV